jgi:ankyrin repeat protein
MTTLALPLLISFALAEAADETDSVRIGWIAGIHHYVEEGDLERLKELLTEHPELINAPRARTTKPSHNDGFTPLHHAAERGHEKIVAYLIEKKANVNANGGGGWTPLHLAAEKGQLAIVKLLVKAGAKVNAKTDAVPAFFGIPPSSPPGATPIKLPAIPSRTPLEVAADAKQAKVVEFLTPLMKKSP